jgi:tripeptide aminopeptidase
MDASVESTTVKLLVRDFNTPGLQEKEVLATELAEAAAADFPGSAVTVEVQESYRNMKEILDGYPDVRDNALEAIRRAGLKPSMEPIRGGTDGSKLSFMGLPTPNIFAGEHNFHSRYEWISTSDMHKAVEVIIELCRVWEEQA